jgi:hypothetical protein
MIKEKITMPLINSKGSKQYKDFNVILKIDDEDKRLWMSIETTMGYGGKYQSASWFVNPPNFIEKWFGVTWQDKIADREKKLFKELFKKIKREPSSTLAAEIAKWEQGANNVK